MRTNKWQHLDCVFRLHLQKRSHKSLHRFISMQVISFNLFLLTQSSQVAVFLELWLQTDCLTEHFRGGWLSVDDDDHADDDDDDACMFESHSSTIPRPWRKRSGFFDRSPPRPRAIVISHQKMSSSDFKIYGCNKKIFWGELRKGPLEANLIHAPSFHHSIPRTSHET